MTTFEMQLLVRDILTPPHLSIILSPSQCIIYLLIESPKLQSLLTNEGIRESLARLHIPTYVDQDGLFDETRNCDYSHTSGGVSRERFVTYYLSFISECVNQRGLQVYVHVLPLIVYLWCIYICVYVYFIQVESDAESFLVTLSFAFTLLGRRMFFQHAQSGSSRRGSVAVVTVSRTLVV